MNPSSVRSHSTARNPNPQPTSSSRSEDAFHVPPIDKAPEGRTWPAEGMSLPPQPTAPGAPGATSGPKGKGGGQQ